LIDESGKGELRMDMVNIVFGLCNFPNFMDPGASNVVDGINQQIRENGLVEKLVLAFVKDTLA
jgi:hypothetical protein